MNFWPYITKRIILSFTFLTQWLEAVCRCPPLHSPVNFSPSSHPNWDVLEPFPTKLPITIPSRSFAKSALASHPFESKPLSDGHNSQLLSQISGFPFHALVLPRPRSHQHTTKIHITDPRLNALASLRPRYSALTNLTISSTVSAGRLSYSCRASQLIIIPAEEIPSAQLHYVHHRLSTAILVNIGIITN